MNELESIQSLIGRTINDVVSGNWPDFLRTAAWSYKYSFPNQLLIYAQQPNATACASIETWNNRLYRTVRSDATHIALIDDIGDQMQLRYVVDVRDTEGEQPAPIWHMTNQNEAYVHKVLSDQFLTASDADFETPTEFFSAIARHLADDYIEQASLSLSRVLSDATHMKELTLDEVESVLKDLLITSTAAVLMYRCDLEPDFTSQPDIFDKLSLFEDPRILSILGQTTQAMSNEALLVIAEAVRTWDKTHKEEINHEHRNQLSESRGIFDPGSEHSGTGTSEQIQSDAEELSEGSTSERIHSSYSDRGTSEPSDSDGRTGRIPSSRDDGSVTKDQPGSVKSRQQSGMGTAHAQPSEASRRTGSSGNNLRIDSNTVPDASSYGIHIQFPTVSEQKAAVKSRGSKLTLPQEEVDFILTNSLNGQVSLQALHTVFSDLPGRKAMLSAVRNNYQNIQHGLLLSSGHYAVLRGRASGLSIICDNHELTLSWSFMISRIQSLISEGRYITQSHSQDHLDLTNLTAGQIVTIHGKPQLITNITEAEVALQDIEYPILTSSMPRAVFESILSEPGLTESEPSEVSPVTSADDYPLDIPITPDPLIDDAQQSTLFVSSIDSEVIDHILQFGSNTEESRKRIATQFMKGKSSEEIAAFIKSVYHGGYGFEIGDDRFAAWYGEDGIRIAPGSSARDASSADLIPWQSAAIRIGQLLDEGQFLTQAELAAAPGYERLKIAESIWYLYRDFSETAKEQGYMPSVKDIRGQGFPFETWKLSKLLEDPQFVSEFISEYKQFVEAYQQDRSLLRFHYYRPTELLIRLQELELPRKTYTSQITEYSQIRNFITEDELNHALTRGSGVSEGKFRIYDHFQKNPSKAETIEFLKKEYGIGGHSHALSGSVGSAEDHDAKGIRYQKGNCPNVDMSWPNVIQRIKTLIKYNRYLTPQEIEHYPQWLLEQEEKQRLREEELQKRRETSNYSNEPIEPPTDSEVHEVAEPTEAEPFINELTEPEESEQELTLFDFTFDSDTSEHSEDIIDIVPAAEVIPVQAVSEIASSERHNYTITDLSPNYGGPKTRFQNNLAAIRLLKQVESEDRLASSEEQEILSKYVGWGGLSQAFDPDNTQWSIEYEELKGLLTPEEYASARESTLTAFYTPPVVTEAIYTVLRNMGYRRGNILDPCCGTGNFFGMLPEDMNESRLYGVELDSISGRISRQLYQKANILIEGYEKAVLPDSFYDVAIGNVPFGSYKLHDRRYDKENFLIHDYFIAKSLDKVRPGGIVAFVTSSGTMDKENESVRRYIAQRADLLGAIRLPNQTFKTNAATETVTDILFLQKRSRAMVNAPDWLGLDYAITTGESTIPHKINAYFTEHPEMVLGDLKETSGPYGPELTCVAREGEDLRDALQQAVRNISGEIEFSFDDPEQEVSETIIPADPNVRNFSFTIVDGDIYFREDSYMQQVELNATAAKRVKGMIELRDCTRELIDAQVQNASDWEISEIQKKLNDLYDAYTKKYGIINSRANSIAFSDDSSYYLLCSLEHIDDEGNFIGKADMFTKRTIGTHNVASHTDTAQEALSVSMGELGRVDLDYMSRLSDLTKDELLSDLTGIIFPVPGREDTYELSSTYLSGNVREKLNIAQRFAYFDPQFNVNAEYLQNVLPEPLTPEDISVRLGSTWIPDTDITAFIHELLQPSASYYKEHIHAIYEPITDTWTITNKNWDSWNSRANSTYGTKRAHAYRLIEDALNQKNTQIFDTIEDADGNQKRVLNANDTIEAREKQEQIKEKFKEWIWSDPERSERLCKRYNERFNSIVPPEYDGNMVTFHNMNPLIKLEKHQKEAVARIIYGGNTQLAHVVGAGKTWTMVAAAMESKYLGLCNKSLIVVPNHLVGQWASAIYDLYPSANVLASTKKDFETKNRKKFCSRIATGDYDIVVIGHSQFERIPLSYERQEQTLQDQIDDIVDSISIMKQQNSERFTIKQLEATKKRLTTRLQKLQDGKRRDDVVTFEELGIDRLFVDESHEYKNLFLYSKMRNVAGISQTDSQKASDLFMKCRYMDEITGNKGNIHATGTPLSNTMAELYTTQRYLQYDLLQSMGLGSFDAWASTFGETVQSLELAPEGTGYRERTRFANFFNIPELVNIYKQVADIRTTDMLNLPVPEVEYHTDVVQASEEQKEGILALSDRAEKIRKGEVKSDEDNMLVITNDGRKLALDQRLMDPSLPDNPNSKANACADNILRYYKEGNDQKLTQLVFSDLSTPKGNGEFNVYDDLKQKLIERGIPAEEIRFIHEANSDAQKEALFSQVRSGAVRVLMGSTGKMGTGTNVQDRLIAGHDLDVPWRPSDLEQRAGRIIRRGNHNSKVHVHRYVTEGTFDAYCYQLIEAKQRFASQIMTSKSPVRVAADIDESVLNYSQIKALASGNPKIREKIELEIEVARLTMLEGRHKREQYRLKNLITHELPEKIKSCSERLDGLEADYALVNTPANQPNEEQTIPIRIMNQSYEKPEDVRKAILDLVDTVSEPDKWYQIGSLRGFKVLLYKPAHGERFSLALSNSRRYQIDVGQKATGIMVRLNNILDKTIPEAYEECKENLSNLQKQLESAKNEYGTPFASSELLKTKTARLKELELELNLEQSSPDSNQVIDSAEHSSGTGEKPSPVIASRSLNEIIASASERCIKPSEHIIHDSLTH